MTFEISTSAYISLKADFKLESNPKYIILGHSHATYAYNDSLIEEFANLSTPGETYFYAFLKTRKILEQNDSIKIVFIEYSNNNIDQEMDNKIWGDKILFGRYPVFSSFAGFKEHFILLSNNFKGYVKVMGVSSYYKMRIILQNNLDFTKNIGHYGLKDETLVDSLVNVSFKTDFKESSSITNYTISDTNLEYLVKMLSLCKEFNKKVILIRTPIHECFPSYFNESIYQKLLKPLLINAEYMDLSKLPLRNSDFYDFEHLNYSGATKYSIWFNMLLKEGFLDDRINQKLLTEKIKSFPDMMN